MVIVSVLPRAEFGQNDHREDAAPLFSYATYDMRPKFGLQMGAKSRSAWVLKNLP